jgi:hypothetical protein
MDSPLRLSDGWLARSNHPTVDGEAFGKKTASIAASPVSADAAVDHTEARNDILGCVGRSG